MAVRSGSTSIVDYATPYHGVWPARCNLHRQDVPESAHIDTYQGRELFSGRRSDDLSYGEPVLNCVQGP